MNNNNEHKCNKLNEKVIKEYKGHKLIQCNECGKKYINIKIYNNLTEEEFFDIFDKLSERMVK